MDNRTAAYRTIPEKYNPYRTAPLLSRENPRRIAPHRNRMILKKWKPHRTAPYEF